MINVINKNKCIHAAIVLLLIVCILVNSAVPARAELALTTGIIAVIGTILVASGMSFDSDSSMTAAAKNFWKSIDSDTKTAIAAIADQYADFMTGNPLQKFVFKISKPVVAAVAGWLSGLGVSSDSTSVSVPVSSGLPFVYNVKNMPLVYIKSGSGLSVKDRFASNPELFVQISSGLWVGKWSNYSDGSSSALSVIYPYGSSYMSSSLFFDGTSLKSSWVASSVDFSFSLILIPANSTNSSYYIGLANADGSYTSPIDRAGSFSVASLKEMGISVDAGSLSIPIAPDYIPAGSGTKPLDSDCDIVLPSGLVKTGTGADTIDSDLVGTMTPDSVRDTSTDVDVPDTGILSGIRDLVGDIAGAITGTLSDLLTGIKTGIDSIATTLGNFFDVSQFELDFSPFQVGLTKIFPFCIPFDFFNGIKLFAQQADNFSFDIQLDTDYFKIDHSVDLSHFKIPFAFFRFVAVFWFSYILISRTRDFMKW